MVCDYTVLEAQSGTESVNSLQINSCSELISHFRIQIKKSGATTPDDII